MSKRKSKNSPGDLKNISAVRKMGRISRQIDQSDSVAEKSAYFTVRTDSACRVSKLSNDATAPLQGLAAPVTDGPATKSDCRPSKKPDPDDGTFMDETASKAALTTLSVHSASSARLGRSFYDHPGQDLAQALLGKLLVRRLAGGMRLSGRIVETEAYLGKVDKAAHSFKKKTDRNAAMFMDPGTAYVYNIYGMYCCMNISSQGEGCAVLLRALEPVEGMDEMARTRQPKGGKAAKPKELKKENLCDGPSKLCQALSISKVAINAQDMTTSSDIWLEDGDPVDKDLVVVTKRINIGYAEDWVDKPLRFYILDSKFVSKSRDKEAEKLLRDKA